MIQYLCVASFYYCAIGTHIHDHTLGTAPEYNSTIVERGNTHIHDHTLGTAPEYNSTIVERGICVLPLFTIALLDSGAVPRV
jgi:hypothetical protein